jgi:multiple sugar transport system substrate-binding protein
MSARRSLRRKSLSAGLCIVTSLGVGVAGSSSVAEASGTVHLTYSLWDSHEEIGYKESIAQFEKVHPNISVTVELIPYTSYESKLTAEFSSGAGPDVFWVGPQWEPSWVQDRVMANLAPDIKKAHVDLSLYYPSLVSLESYKGAIYGLPKDWDTIAYYYNETYFQQHHISVPANLTWNPSNGGTFLTLLEEATTDANGVNALSSKFNPNDVKTYGTDVPNEFQTGFGSFWAENGVSMLPHPYATSVSFNTSAGESTIQFLQNLMYKWHVALPGSELGSNAEANNSQDINAFTRGQTAMLEYGDWGTSTIGPAAQAAHFKVGVIPLPAGPDGRVSVTNGLFDGVNAHTPNFQAAWELEQWLFSPTSERILGAGGFIWPGIKSLDPLFLSYWKAHGIDLTPFLDEQHGKTIPYPLAVGAFDALTSMGRDLGPVFLNSGGASSALKSAASDANAALQNP